MKAARNPLAFRRLPCSFSRQQRSDNFVIQDSPPVVPVLQSLKLSYANRGQKRGLPTKALHGVKHSKVEDTPDTTSVLSFPPPPPLLETTEDEMDWSKMVHSAQSPPARISPQPHVRFTPVDSVVEIPSHRDYTALEKRSIWTSLQVLRNQAKRNRIEWFWEGCDVEGVVEEEAFSYDFQGCLKHPAHFEAKKTKRRRI
jgi:hypothetical protein